MDNKVRAIRHISQEARTLLTSLRSGPPHVARGELAQDLMDLRDHLQVEQQPQQDHDALARPFLNVVTDPRAAGPHTLVALRCLCRLLQAQSLQLFHISYENCTQGILACKFEQTDAGADEAVEMAIADVLALLIALDENCSIQSGTFMDAFNTIFVTRNTFVHSPALCYHFEDVLKAIVESVMSKAKTDEKADLLMEFLVSQLLHTPLTGDGMDESIRDAQSAHDANRVLCLRLCRTAIAAAWGERPIDFTNQQRLVSVVQDGLCLSLLMTGQAIWSFHDANMDISPGFVSLEVLSEICISTACLWNTPTLRPYLVAQFENIFTGFYTRALVLLRKRKQAVNSLTFNANLIFDSEVEIILESLVDILCLHDHNKSITDGDGGALETLFALYDCDLNRSDVAAGLYVELCRACGGQIDQEGEAIMTPANSMAQTPSSESLEHLPEESDIVLPEYDEHWRPVPAHLKELCAQALIGGMKCLFQDDNPSQKRKEERAKRKSIMLKQMDNQEEGAQNEHVLRDVKSKKRLLRKAARLFNEKASRGIEFLAMSGLLPDPVTPISVATFLRNGIVLGLDKKAVGAYLGEAGKAPVAGKSPQTWDRDWFHRDVLKEYCNLFRFEGQRLLDGLRMFLAAFRLPGEAQQIDRILQTFADSCSRACEESSAGRLKLFSEDPKRASDAAYLLSFSIIMLNTDRHNENIREDRKMKVEDFIKNNTDYGRDITDKGKEFPREYLAEIYDSINDEQIRTMGEGADGAMTVERWKDVLRQVSEVGPTEAMSLNDAEDLTELVLEHVWKPIISAVGAFWGMSRSKNPSDNKKMVQNSESHNGMLGVQGARLGMDISTEMMYGVRQLGRIDIFRKIFSWVCVYTGLLGDYDVSASERTWRFTKSVEAQSALVVAFRMALDAGEDLGEDSWKRLWSIILEMRDLKLIKYARDAMSTLLKESEADLLNENARRDWSMCLAKGDMDFDAAGARKKQRPQSSSMLGSLGRALFGSSDWTPEDDDADRNVEYRELSIHGKDELVIWDECASSDIEDEDESLDANPAFSNISAGARFEHELIRENIRMNEQIQVPVTGLERAEDLQKYQRSPRARVRGRIRKTAGYQNLIPESRFLNDDGIITQLKSLSLLTAMARECSGSANMPPPVPPPTSLSRSFSDVSNSSGQGATNWKVPISQASEAFAEVVIAEIALKNKDRLKLLWEKVLQEHYIGSLTKYLVSNSEERMKAGGVDPGLEKRISGLLRISAMAVQREEIANEILSAWSYLLPTQNEQEAVSPLRYLGKHMAEGLWRIVSNVDGVAKLEQAGWEGLLSLSRWCAKNGFSLKSLSEQEAANGGLPDDDPALMCYKAIHFLLESPETQTKVPCSIIGSIRSLVLVGDVRNCPQLAIASLDMMGLLLERRLESIEGSSTDSIDMFWSSCWRHIVEAVAEGADKAQDPSIRQHALSTLTDLFLDKQGSKIPPTFLSKALSDICVPLAGRCIYRLKLGDESIQSSDMLMIEYELCIGLIFKPLRHHLRTMSAQERSPTFLSIWKSVLQVLEELLVGDKGKDSPKRFEIPSSIKKTMDSLANEHLQNAIIVLLSLGLIQNDKSSEINTYTWDSVKRMGFSDSSVNEWMQAASAN